MGTTVTLAGVYQSSLYLAQIGDSRGYLARGGQVIQLTKDQSLMQRLVDAGELTEEEAEQSERRNIILQALGPDPRVKVDLTFQSLRRGDTLVICSDGLSGQVKREEIGQLIEQHRQLPALCGALIDLANGRGGPDNITVIAARFEGEGLPEPEGASGVGYQVYQMPEAAPASEEEVAVAAPASPASSKTPVSAAPHGPPVSRASALPPSLVVVAGLVALAAIALFLALR